NRHAAVQIGAVALEERVRSQRKKNIKVARRPAAHAGLAFAGEANARAVLDTRGDIDRKRALARQKAALAVADAAVAVAVLAGLRLGAGLGAVAGAGLAGHRGRQPHL